MSDIKYLSNIDLTGLEIKNALAQNLATNPTAQGEGQFIYNTATNTLNYWNGTTWVELDGTGDIAGVTAGNGLSGGGTSGTVSLAVNVDNTTLEINSDTVRAKTAAIVDGGTGLATADQIHTFVDTTYAKKSQTLTFSGDVSGSGAANSSIALTIGANAVEHGMLNDNIISGQGALTSGLVSTDELLVSDAGTVKKMDISVLQTYMQSNLTFTTDTNTVLSSASFNNTNGVLTLTNTGDGAGTVTVDLDGRYLLTSDAAEDSTITIAAGDGLQTGGAFTLNQSADETITIDVDGTVVRTSGAQTIGGDKTFSNDVVISGDLTVNGTTTTINTDEVNIADNIIVLNSDFTAAPVADAGIEVERGTSDNVNLQWDEGTDRWQFTNDGTTFYNIPIPSEYTAYVHPTHPGDDINIDTGALTGATVISDLDFNITTDTNGHVTDANATVNTRTLTHANLGSITISGDSGSRDIATNTSLTIAGGSQLSTSVSGGTLTINHSSTGAGDISAQSDLNVVDALTFDGAGHVTGATTRDITNDVDDRIEIREKVYSLADATSGVSKTSNTYTVTHGLGTVNVMTQVFDASTGETVQVCVARTAANTVDVAFAAAVTDGDYTILIKKIG